MQREIENILGDYYHDSIFDELQERAVHTVRATALLIDVKRKYVDVEVL